MGATSGTSCCRANPGPKKVQALSNMAGKSLPCSRDAGPKEVRRSRPVRGAVVLRRRPRQGNLYLMFDTNYTILKEAFLKKSYNKNTVLTEPFVCKFLVIIYIYIYNLVRGICAICDDAYIYLEPRERNLRHL